MPLQKQLRKQQDRRDDDRTGRADKDKGLAQHDINSLVVTLAVEQTDDRRHGVAAAGDEHRDERHGKVADREHRHAVSAGSAEDDLVEQNRLDKQQDRVDDRGDTAGA